MVANLEQYAGYLFAYFKGERYEDGEQVYFALSEGNNALSWRELNGGRPVLVSTMGEKGVRDPYIVRSPLGDSFYLVATDLRIHSNGDWNRAVTAGSRSIMIWNSSNLVDWSNQSMVELAPEGAGCTWAPEVFRDSSSDVYYLFWASMLDGSLPDTDRYHRMMVAETKDFVTFSKPKVYMDYGYSVIDTTMIEAQGSVYRISKGQNIMLESGSSFYDPSFKLINGSVEQPYLRQGEGPIIFKSNTEDKWYAFIDEYVDRGYIPLETTDLSSGIWSLPEHYSLPASPRHGSVIPVTKLEYDRLLERYGG
ncbi:glycoside hydrolase family 43 protein [Paenibacillus sp. LHD-38]|uniref:glycoside hydrolase family 43 protein n=1 Tax=Paenibacillus sp. LHD-38 TaxID=3072143 RepID=UPI00280D4892|nr:glycoside hydrolase family 43 protein [Paenibacillus sp. LHD-38]MDQ8734562.1 glycoside hydrolase family 43 protein [Paenibacillus sp. LHD-38]